MDMEDAYDDFRDEDWIPSPEIDDDNEDLDAVEEEEYDVVVLHDELEDKLGDIVGHDLKEMGNKRLHLLTKEFQVDREHQQFQAGTVEVDNGIKVIEISLVFC